MRNPDDIFAFVMSRLSEVRCIVMIPIPAAHTWLQQEIDGLSVRVHSVAPPLPNHHLEYIKTGPRPKEELFQLYEYLSVRFMEEAMKHR